MKKTIYILMMGAALVLSSCNKDVKPIQVERTSGIHTVEPWATYIQGTGTVNAIGDEVWPHMRERAVWQTVRAVDQQAIYVDPLQFYLSAGEHEIALHYVDQPVIYKSSKPEIAFIDENGNIEARGKGKAKFTAKVNGKAITISVNVK